MRDFSIVPTTLRVAGPWESLAELIDRLPDGFFTGPIGTGPDAGGLGYQIAGADEKHGRTGVLHFRDPDDQFAGLVRQMTRTPLSEEESETLDDYKMQICVCGDGGSKFRAANLMRATDAVVGAGGCAVFCDSSGATSPGSLWRDMTAAVVAGGEDMTDAMTFALVSVIGDDRQARTTGMQVLGLPDLVMQFDGIPGGGERLIEMMRYIARTDREFTDGHIMLDPTDGLSVTAKFAPVSDQEAPSMANPWGRLELVRTETE